MYQHARLYLTRIFFGFLIVLLLISDNNWENRSPMFSAVFFLTGCFLAGIASLGRLWCSLYIVGYKTKRLIVSGPYSICRHPLYFFSMLGGIGAGLATETITIPVLILIAFALYYPYVIRFEENKLNALYGSEYEEYVRTVPQFWPKWSLLTEPEEYVVNPIKFKRHIFSALWFIWILGILEFIEMFRELKMLPALFSLY